jgi:hypothetical protein
MTLAGQVINLPLGHIAGIPIEETLAPLGPVLFVILGAALGSVHARWRRVRRATAERALGRSEPPASPCGTTAVSRRPH